MKKVFLSTSIAIVLTFVALAVVHIVNLTNQGLINWKY